MVVGEGGGGWGWGAGEAVVTPEIRQSDYNTVISFYLLILRLCNCFCFG